MFKKLKKIINDITEQPPKECWVCGDEHIISRGIRFEPYCPDCGFLFDYEEVKTVVNKKQGRNTKKVR